MEDLEVLLKNERDVNETRISVTKNSSPKSIQKADKLAKMEDMIAMIQLLVNKTLKDLNIKMVPDDMKKNLLEADEKIDHPYITFHVISREPKTELKPRHREEINEISYDKEEQRLGAVFGQSFKCIVQFNIFASEYSLAEQVMERFEEMIFLYTGYLKKNGVGEILFKEQLADEAFDSYREILSVRNLRYYVEIEKLTVVFQEKIKEIETELSLIEEVK